MANVPIYQTTNTQSATTVRFRLIVSAVVASGLLGGLFIFLAWQTPIVVETNCPTVTVDAQTLPTTEAQKAENRSRLEQRGRSLLEKSAAYINRQRKQPRLLRDIVALARERKRSLLELMRTDPDAAGALIFSDDERKAVGSLTLGCVERNITTRGALRKTYLDDFENKQSETRYTLRTERGDLGLSFSGGIRSEIADGEVTLAGVLIDNQVLVDGASSMPLLSKETPLGGIEQQIQSWPPNPTTGPQKTLVILVNDPPDNHTTPTAQDWQSAMNVLKAYYDETSYHQISFEGVLDPSAGADVIGWVTPTPRPPNIVPDLYDIMVAAQALAQANGTPINFQNYLRLVTVGGHSSMCTGNGASIVTTPDGDVFLSLASIPWRGEPLIWCTGHEIGHALDLMHANFANCGTGLIGSPGVTCQSNEYDDIFDVMGKGAGHFNAIFKELSGWLTGNRLESVVGPVSVTRDIGSLETDSDELKVLKIQRSQNDYFTIEYRQPIGFDANAAQDVYAGALFHFSGTYLNHSNFDSHLADLTPTGGCDSRTPTLHLDSQYTDVNDGITIENIAPRVPGKLTVRISFDSTYDIWPPVLSYNAPSDGSIVSGTSVPISLHATDATGVQKIELSLTHNGVKRTVATLTAPTEGSRTNGVWTTTMNSTLFPNGANTLTAVAYDTKSAVSEALNRTITITNTDPTPPTVTITTADNAVFTFQHGYTPSATINAAIADNIGIDRVEVYRDAETIPWLTRTFSFSLWPIQFSSAGEHTVRLVAYDFVGNSAEDSVRVILRDASDATPPTVSFLSPQNDDTVGNTVSLRATASDAAGIAKVDYFLDDSSFIGTGATDNNYLLAWDASAGGLVNGTTHTLTAKAWDVSGNNASAVLSVTIVNTGGTKGTPSASTPGP